MICASSSHPIPDFIKRVMSEALNSRFAQGAVRNPDGSWNSRRGTLLYRSQGNEQGNSCEEVVGI